MPIIKPQGLKGLSFNNLSDNEKIAFMSANSEKLNIYRNPVQRKQAAEALFMNQKFINTYGIDAFNKMDNGTQESFNLRNNYLKEDIVNQEWNKLYSPFNTDGTRNNKKGLGADFEKYSQLSTDAKLKVLESDYLTPSEFEHQWQKDTETSKQNAGYKKGQTNAFIPGTAFTPVQPTMVDYNRNTGVGEAAKKLKMDKNQRILDTIYNDDVDAAASRFSNEVNNAYFSPEIASLSDDQVKKAFVRAITPSKGNLGISEYASHYGNGSENTITSEMKNFSVDDMRQVLAKKKVYDANMSPDMAATALNNDAKRYIKDNQGTLKRLGLFAKDVGISTLSYTADKVNGIYNLGLIAADKLMDKPVVMVDDKGSIIDPNTTHIVKDKSGNLRYQDNEGQIHTIHQEQINRTTLHQMGKDFDGSEDNSILNQQYWTRAEQFGTLDEDEQKQYEKLGSSPYKVAYNPNEDSDLLYESFKMMSFGLGDALSQAIPFGIGALGKTLSTASKLGKVVNGLGKAINVAGRTLTAQSKAGQLIQGGAGALGIANAYQRGAFQETLQKNLSDAEETVLNTSRNDIYNQYNNNKDYKAEVDKLIEAEAAKEKALCMAQAKREGNQVIDEKVIDKMLHVRAQEVVLGDLVQRRVAERKSSQEYADLQQKAIQGAGDAATATFLPEAIKYGFVNTMGFRKWLYTNPSGLMKKVSSSLKGLKEVTTKEGLKRMGTDASKFLTTGQKWKEFGKTFGSQAWGGAWTNGTDDMQVDAAERMNEDSFGKYLHQYQNGEALADTYGFADGIFSYMKGLSNSMGQETTWSAAAVGALGSIVNFTPNFANIAHLATKEGREAYKNNFFRTPEVKTGENGEVYYKRYEADDNEGHKKGDIIYEDTGRLSNIGGQINYFLQNGVLNNYYGKKQAEKDLQQHADYVNNLLDSYDDFKDIEQLVASDIALQNVESIGDEKTMRFVNAINSVNALNNLGKDSKDPTTMSSVVQNAKTLIDKASQLNLEEGRNPFSEDEITNLLSQYYANNPGVEQSEENNQKALYYIAQNAQKLKEASDAFNKAETEIQKIEKNEGITIDPSVRLTMKTQQALNGHWQERVDKMKEEIDDTSSDMVSGDSQTIIATVGGIKNAQSLVRVYEKQEAEIQKELEDQKKETEVLHTKTVEAVNAVNDVRDSNDSNALLEADKKHKDALSKEESARQQEKYLEDLIVRTQSKKDNLQRSIDYMQSEETPEENRKEKILTADEIFGLDAVTRARMMKAENRDFYSKSQQREIEKLEQQLLMKDADVLQKIQDISLLTQRIDANRDAYSRLAQNSEAAAVAIESQRKIAADSAYRLVNQRNAETLANSINQFDEAMKGHEDISDDSKNEYVFRTLRKFNSNLLDIIDNDEMLPKYQKQVRDAKDFVKVLDDVDAVVSQADRDEEWKKNLSNNINNVVESSSDRASLLSNFEKVIDDTDNPQVAEDFEYILKGLENQGYQRDATVIENRQQRRQREEEAKKKLEEERKNVEAEAKKAADKAVEEKQKAENNPNNANLLSISEEIDLPIDENTSEESTKESNQQSSEEEDITPEVKSNEVPTVSTPEDMKQKNSAEDIENSEKSSNFAETKDTEKVTTTENNPIIEDEDTVQGNSQSIEQQANEAEGIEVSDTTNSIDADTTNAQGERSIETNSTTLSGNAMSEYEIKPLQEEGRLVHKKGSKENDSMNQYYDWMKAAGIKLQNIIDQELGQIIRRNSNAKVKFMSVKPDKNATNDVTMQNHLMLVLDYDNAANNGITSIHNPENGGVIESNGKKYLVIGTVGYGNRNVDKLALYDMLWNSNKKDGLNLKKQRKEFFDAHPTERFYVNEELNTEVVPMSLIPGYIVRQTENDSNVEYRSISDILADGNRNPMHYDMQSLAWGIQEVSKFLTVGASVSDVMVPRATLDNSGSAFILIPASNGKMVPTYMRPLKYNEIQEGSLKERVGRLLDDVIAPNYATRYQAVIGLSNIFYFDKNGANILLRKNKNEISLVHDGNVFKTFVLNSDFDRGQFMQAMEEMNPRVNVTASVLRNPQSLMEYDEAGALMTDAAMLTTAGSSYSIYGLDGDGNIIKPQTTTDNTVTRVESNSDFRSNNRHQIPFKHNFYVEDNGTYYLNGIPVTDEATIRQLDYNRQIRDSQLTPAMKKDVLNYYILSDGEHPEAIMENRNTHEIKSVSEEETKEIIQKANDEKAKKEREEKAQKALDSAIAQGTPDRATDVNLGEGEFTIDAETGEPVIVTSNITSQKEEERREGEASVEQQENTINDNSHRSVENLNSKENKVSTQNFIEMFNKIDFSSKLRIKKIIEAKWSDAPKSMADLEKFLRSKNVEVDAIGTSEADIEAWIKTLEDCR